MHGYGYGYSDSYSANSHMDKLNLKGCCMARKIVCLVVLTVIFCSLGACARPMTICGVTYDSYGLLNSDEKRNPDIQYELVWGNLILGAIFVETVVAPIYFFGFSIFEPVGQKPKVKGEINRAPADCKAPTS